MKIEMLRIQYDYDKYGLREIFTIECNVVQKTMFNIGLDMLGDIGRLLNCESILVSSGSDFTAMYHRDCFDIPDPRMHDMFLRICLSTEYNSTVIKM